MVFYQLSVVVSYCLLYEGLLKGTLANLCRDQPCVTKPVGTFWGGGGGQKYLRGFLLSHLYFRRIQFCTLVYLWF